MATKLSEYNGQIVETIDCTPTWLAVLPGLLEVIENTKGEGRKIAREEIKTMAMAADRLNELFKSGLMYKMLSAFNQLPNKSFQHAGERVTTYELASELTEYINSVKVN
jgi:hypothetical protein